MAFKEGWEVVQRSVDKGISGSKDRDGRPAFDELCKGIVRREFDVVAAGPLIVLASAFKT